MNEALRKPAGDQFNLLIRCVFAMGCWLVLSSLTNWLLAIANAFELLEQSHFEAVLRSNARLAFDCFLLAGTFFAQTSIWKLLKGHSTLKAAFAWAFVSLFSSLSTQIF